MKKFIGWFILLVFILLASFIYWKYFFTFSEGSRVGSLLKVSKKGNVFKTYEGEMILNAGYDSPIPLSYEKFFFSMKDVDTYNKLQQLQNVKVEVFYKEKNGVLPWVGESKYLVDSVKVANVNESLPPGMR